MKMKLKEKTFVLVIQLKFKEPAMLYRKLFQLIFLKGIKFKKIYFPKNCLCGATTKKELSKSTKKHDAVRRCLKGYDCTFIAKEKLKHIVSKEAFNIDGLGKKVIEQFWDLNLIKEPSDIFDLNYNEIKKLDGWGELSIDNLKKLSKNLKRFL